MFFNDLMEDKSIPGANTCVSVYTRCTKCIKKHEVTLKDEKCHSYASVEMTGLNLSHHMREAMGGRRIAAWLGYDNALWSKFGFIHAGRITTRTTSKTYIDCFSTAMDCGQVVTSRKN
jgi:hypothetical protein